MTASDIETWTRWLSKISYQDEQELALLWNCTHVVCAVIYIAQGQEYFAVTLKTLKSKSKGAVKNSQSQYIKHSYQHSRGIKIDWDKRNQNRLCMYNFHNIISKINTHYFNGIKYVPTCLTWFTILVSFPDEFAVERMVVGHHPLLLTSSVLRQAH